jgi:23S rRNA (guanine745-N1)-methyltransferase
MTITASTPTFACPVCGQPLLRADRSYRCVNGHPFDIAREGYVNLLLPQHRRSKDPGYNKEMVASRRDFFDAGHYEPLADGVAGLIASYLPDGDRVVVDAGCGEGYYLRRLRALLAATDAEENTLLCGMDLSKYGIRVAARRDPQGLYAVAGTYRMPVLPAVVDVLLTHFSPVSAEDFRRVVKPGGVVLVGGPAEGHLFGLKELMYDTPGKVRSGRHPRRRERVRVDRDALDPLPAVPARSRPGREPAADDPVLLVDRRCHPETPRGHERSGHRRRRRGSRLSTDRSERLSAA